MLRNPPRSADIGGAFEALYLVNVTIGGQDFQVVLDTTQGNMLHRTP